MAVESPVLRCYLAKGRRPTGGCFDQKGGIRLSLRLTRPYSREVGPAQLWHFRVGLMRAKLSESQDRLLEAEA